MNPSPLVVVNEPKMLVRANGQYIPLTAMEYKLLLRLMSAQGAVVSYGAILREVWKKDHTLKNEWTLHTHIYRLRRKFKKHLKNRAVIHTVKGFGCAYDENRG